MVAVKAGILADEGGQEGANVASIWRYERDFKAEGYEGLIPDISTGRKTVLQKLGFTKDQVRELMGTRCQA